ncbi:MAG: tetratricopeptide repeat protein [Candidatus Moraniibacteriota bacterium]|nr:MAG: tetratricopeptide repeat protein [Candidatus Moranbacteria bacterium]
MNLAHYIFSKKFALICSDVLTAFFFFVAIGGLFSGSIGLTLQGSIFEQYTLFLLGILSALIFWLTRSFIVGKIEIPRTTADAPMLLVLLVFGISSFLSDDVWHSMWGVFGDPGRGTLSFFAYILLYYITLHLVRISKVSWIKNSLVLGVFSLIAFLVLWEIIPSFFQIVSLTKKEEMFHHFPSIIIILLGTLPLLWGAFQERLLQVTEKKIFLSIQFFLLSILSFLTMFFSIRYFSNMSFWWILFMISGWFLLTVAVIIGIKFKSAWFPSVIFLFCVLGYFSGKVIFPMTESTDGVMISFQNSFQIAYSSFLENPFFGVGPSLYSSAFSLYRHLDLNQTSLVLERPSQAEGMIFEVPVTSGISGFLAFSFLILYTIGSGFLAGYKRGGKYLFFWIGSVISLLFLTLTIIFFPVAFPVFALWFVVMAFTLSLRKSQSDMQSTVRIISTRPRPEYILSAAFAFLVVFSFFIYGYIFLAKGFFADFFAKKAVLNSSQEDAISFLKRSIELNPFESRYYILLANQYVKEVKSQKIESTDENYLKMIEKNMNLASEYAVRSKNMTPKDVVAWEMSGQIYEELSLYVDDFIDICGESYDEAIKLEPQNPRLHMKRGELFIRKAMTKEGSQEKEKYFANAKKEMEISLGKKEEFPQAWYLLALTQEGLGEIEGAIQSIVRALEFIPEEPTFMYVLGRLYYTRGQSNDTTLAIEMYKKVIEKKPEEVHSYLALANIYKKEASLEDALKYFDLALKYSKSEEVDLKNFIEKEKSQLTGTQMSTQDLVDEKEGDENLNSEEISTDVTEPTLPSAESLNPEDPVKAEDSVKVEESLTEEVLPDFSDEGRLE